MEKENTTQLSDLVDESHGIDQQLRVHSVLLLQDFHGVGPGLATCKSIRLSEPTTQNQKQANATQHFSAGGTSLGVHGGDGFDQQRGIGLGILHKHQQELHGRFHH